MTKRTWSGWLLAALMATTGCRMCCPSYDYCGPTEPGESNSEDCGMVRRGSILSGMPNYAEGETYIEEGTEVETTPAPVKAPAPLVAPPDPPRLDPNRSARRSR